MSENFQKTNLLESKAKCSECLPLHDVKKKKIILTLVKMVKKTLFKTVVMGESVKSIAFGERSSLTLHTRKTRRIYLQGEGWGRRSVGGKWLRGDIRGRGILAKNWPNRFLLKAGQDDWISQVGRFSLHWLSRILAKTRLWKEEHGNLRSRPSQEKGSEELD